MAFTFHRMYQFIKVIKLHRVVLILCITAGCCIHLHTNFGCQNADEPLLLCSPLRRFSCKIFKIFKFLYSCVKFLLEGYHLAL